MNKKIKLSYIFYFILGILCYFIFSTDILAATYDTFYVTWYYRNKSNENNLLNVGKGQDTPLYASTSEYVNGYTTRIENTFTKDIQYIINYELQMWFSPEQELNYRSDTLQRIIDYSYTDSDFKILNVTAKENWNRSSSIGDTVLTIKVSMQILALNNTDAIRFGVYTDNNISIGFYNHTDQIDYYLVNNISIEENANATIIDQNNQIIQGQDGINNNITNSTNTITGSITETEDNLNSSIQSSQDNINQNIDDMEDAIVDSNNQTQEVIKDQFNSCRDSYNLLNVNEIYSLTGMKQETITLLPGNYTLSAKSIETEAQKSLFLFRYKDGSGNKYILLQKNNPKQTFTLDSEADLINIYSSDNYSNSQNITTIFTELMLNEGSVAKPYEPYGEEICTNKIDETNKELGDINDALTDSSPTDMSGLEDSIGWLPPGPVDSILNLPLALFNSLSNNLSNKTCISVDLELPFVNKNITLPCVKTLYDKMGVTGTLFQSAGIIASCFILFNYLLALYHWVDDTLTLRENTMPGYYEDNWGGGA